MTPAQQAAMKLIREIEADNESIHVTYASLKAKGVRQRTIDILEMEGYVFTKYVFDNTYLHPCVVRASKELLESLGLKRNEFNRDLWQIDLPDGRSIRAWFNGHNKTGKRWLGKVYYRGDESSSGATDIFDLIATLKEISEPDGV